MPRDGACSFAWCMLLASIVVIFAGCRSGEEEDEEARRKAEEERRLPDFELQVFSTLPNNLDRVESIAKPGHWTAAQMTAVANRDDFQGLLIADPVEIAGTSMQLESRRPALLAKRQAKQLDVLLFIPPSEMSYRVGTRLTTRSGATVVESTQQVDRMAVHQFYLMVLSQEPDRYRFLRRLPSVTPLGGDHGASTEAHYRILMPQVARRVPLSGNPLTWTSIAYLLWDDFDAERLTPDQQRALLDWMHWGGQLIVSGPVTLEELRGSFLEPYLPAEAAGTLELQPDDLATLVVGDGWELSGLRTAGGRPWSGVRLLPRDDSEVLVRAGDEPVVVDWPVGRGRVVVTAFSLGQQELRRWPHFDEMLNACLLRRMPRRIRVDEQFGDAVVEWADHRSRYDGTRTTRLSFFARDVLHEDEASMGLGPFPEPMPTAGTNQPSSERWVNYGVGAWNDYSPIAEAARDSLRGAAGIKIPDAWFVLRVVGIYLVLLVPINWLLFRLAGRVELAWAAVPVLSIAFAVLVARWAQLDIGFARATTEVAIVELQSDYPRAHLTRYVGLYSALSTDYVLDFDEPTALAQPFSDGSQLIAGRRRQTVRLERDEGVRLAGVRVASNSIGMVHAEHMLDLVGTISLDEGRDGLQVFNGTELDLEGVAVLGPDGVAWVGSLRSGDASPLVFEAAGEGLLAQREAAPITAARRAEATLSLRRLVELAESDVPHGEYRLVAWCENELSGMSIRPSSAQARRANLVVAHLRPPALPMPTGDVWMAGMSPQMLGEGVGRTDDGGSETEP